MAHDIFICHAHADYNTALAACAKLEEAHVRCWIAPRDVGAGAYARQLVHAISDTTAVLLIFSDKSNTSENVLRELEIASSRQKIIVPFRLEDVHPNEDLEYFTLRMHWLDALTPPLESRLDELVAFIQRLLAAQPTLPPPVSHESGAELERQQVEALERAEPATAQLAEAASEEQQRVLAADEQRRHAAAELAAQRAAAEQAAQRAAAEQAAQRVAAEDAERARAAAERERVTARQAVAGDVALITPGVATIASLWWVPLLRGIVAFVFGAVLLTADPISLHSFTTFGLVFCTFAVIDGALRIYQALRFPLPSGGTWWSQIVAGVLGILIGLVAGVSPDAGYLLIISFVAWWALLTGGFELRAAFRLRREVAGEWCSVAAAVLSLALGISVLVAQSEFIVTYWLLLLYAILYGALMCTLASRLRGLAPVETGERDQRITQQPTDAAATPAVLAIGNIASHWWVPLLRGINPLVLTAVFFLTPEKLQTAATGRALVCAFLLADGALRVYQGLSFAGPSAGKWWAQLLAGATGILAGIFAGASQEDPNDFLIGLFRVWAILTGGFELFAAFQLRREVPGEWFALAGALLSLFLGVFLNEDRAWVMLAYSIGSALLLGALAIRLRGLAPKAA